MAEETWKNVGCSPDGGAWPGQEAEGLSAIRTDDTTIAYVVDPGDAPLIAAAPRMLALLTDLMADDDTRQSPLGDEYRAILRAIGGQP